MSSHRLVIDGVEIREAADLAEVYARRFAVHGATPETLLYTRTPANHALKIAHYGRLVADLVESQPDVQLLDVGCGFGSLAEYVTPANYCGIDVTPVLVAEARKRYSKHQFLEGALGDLNGTRADVALLIGIMSTVPQPFGLIEEAQQVAHEAVWVDFNTTDMIVAGSVNPDSRLFERDDVDARLAAMGSRVTRHSGPFYYIYQLERLGA